MAQQCQGRCGEVQAIATAATGLACFIPFSETTPTKSKAVAYGGVVIDPHGYLLMREVKNHFDGYVWTFAKGRQDKGESPRETALREVWEEMGINATILIPISGEFAGGTTLNRFFLMVVER
ncbi:NUDIX domain-containing protein [Aeromonas caviae]